jgi:hypothetical protein
MGSQRGGIERLEPAIIVNNLLRRPVQPHLNVVSQVCNFGLKLAVLRISVSGTITNMLEPFVRRLLLSVPFILAKSLTRTITATVIQSPRVTHDSVNPLT